MGRDFICRSALFSDTTEMFVDPAQPLEYDEVKIRFRTASDDADGVFLVWGEKRFPMEKEPGWECFDYYTCTLQPGRERVAYHFEVHAAGQTVYFDTRGPVDAPDEHFAFVLIPGFRTPDWAKGAVMYQIFVDRFCNGDPSNDVLTDEYAYIKEHVHRVEDWNKCPDAMDVRAFYGGDLEGVIQKLDYLQQLGVEAIYFNPLFVSPSNHKYDTQDYDHIDPHIGRILEDGGELLAPGELENRFASKYIRRVTSKANLEASDRLFIRLVEEAHARSIKVILDGVFNHCGSFHKWMDRERIYENAIGYEKGAFVSAESPYRNYFLFQEQERWPYNASYKGWWDHNTLPKLHYEGSRELFEYVMQIGRKWVSAPYHADGWRLDVAADLGFSPAYNHYFWQQFRGAVKEANPEAVILAEHYGSTQEWLGGNEWDSVMNYDAFMEPVTWFLTGMEKHSDAFSPASLGNQQDFWDAMKYHSASFAMPSWQTAMNQLSNHDHSRFLTRTNHKVGRVDGLGSQAAAQDVDQAVFREAVVMQMTWVGAPTIYYGDEAGVCGFTDPDNRRTYPWGQEDQELIAFHRDIIRLRKENPELRTGSIKYVDADYQFLAYGRFDEKGICLILINNQEHSITREVSVWELGVPMDGSMSRLLCSYGGAEGGGYTLDQVAYQVISGRICIELPQRAGVILKYSV